MTIRNGFITKFNEHYVLVSKDSAYKLSRLAGLVADDVEFVAFHKLLPREQERVANALTA